MGSGAYHKRSMGEDTIVMRAAKALRNYCADGKDGLLVGISGGPDSVALLHILHRLQSDGILTNLSAAHMHHGIRGQNADNDAEYVRTLCGQWDIPLFEECADAIALSKAGDMTLEEAARTARYAFLRRAKQNCGAKYIVTAHHRDDQAETIFLHLLRGAGLAGLCGMQVCTDDILRPLLTTSREEILAYIAQQQLSYCTDESNMEACCLRNRIRLELLPLIKRDYNPSIAETISRMAELLSEDEALLRVQAETALDKAKVPDGGYSCSELVDLPMAIKSRAIRVALERAGALYDMQRGGINSVCALLHGRTGAHMELPCKMEARISYGVLYISSFQASPETFEIPLLWPGETITPDGRFSARIADRMRTDEKSNVAYVDADKLSSDLVLRRRRPGDRFFPLGAPGRRKLKEYLIDKKVPRTQRDVPLLASGEDVLFFPGGTVSQQVRVDELTTCILRIEYLPD